MPLENGKLLIACDIDSTIYPLVNEWLDVYNRKTGHGLTRAEISNWYMYRNMTELPRDDVYALLDEVMYEMEPFPDSVRTITQLIEDGNQFVFHSACFNSTQSNKKHAFLHRNFGALEWDVIFGHGYERKLRYLIQHADLVIEDSIKSIRYVTQNNPDCKVIMYNQLWNQDSQDIDMKNVTRVNSWLDIRKELGMD